MRLLVSSSSLWSFLSLTSWTLNTGSAFSLVSTRQLAPTPTIMFQKNYLLQRYGPDGPHGWILQALNGDETTRADQGNDKQQTETSPLLLPTFAPSPNNEKEKEKQSLNWTMIVQQLQLFKAMALPYYQESRTGRWLALGLLGLTFASSGVSVMFSFIGKDFWNALSAKNEVGFYLVMQRFLAALIVGAPVVTLYRYQREQLAVHWREWMTARTIQLYLGNRVYYNLPTTIDNPDQRVAQDVNSFTSYSLELVITVLTSCIDLGSFSVILWNIYPTLFAAIIAYAAAGTVITTVLGKVLVRLNFAQLQKEANLRYSLVRLRDNAESIAFYRGEDLEGQAIEERIESVMANRRLINVAQRNLEFFTNAYRYLVQILPVAVVAPRYFAGQIELGIISQSVGAFNHILSDLSIIVNQFENLSTFSAGIERLSTFFEAMRQVDLARNDTSSILEVTAMTTGTRTGDETNGLLKDEEMATTATVMSSNEDIIQLLDWEEMASPASSSNRPILVIEHLDLATPNRKRVLIRDLSLQIQPGQHLLIVGNSGTGKSSLLRGIAGLWTSGNGTIVRPNDDYVYFLPQRPYCTVGTLKDQLLYPSLDTRKLTSENNTNVNGSNRFVPRAHWLKHSLTDSELLTILEQVDLVDVARRAGDGDAAKGLYTTFDWSNMLSLGEQQRLAFGRLLVNRPRLVILDEATSALDMEAEARMYRVLQSMTLSAADYDGGHESVSSRRVPSTLTYVSVGHRPSLLAYHQKRLRLAGEAAHELADIDLNDVKASVDIANL